MDSQAASSMSDFSDKDRKELQQFIENEQQKSKFQTNVHNLTDMCWSKCMTSKITGTAIDKEDDREAARPHGRQGLKDDVREERNRDQPVR
ncbi:uncharacterized protein LAJ45_07935 [Morchella importuna]|uniref:uncharacterized protein n=1 Tax=Morchella importuna TaxID=1174673 RepID=UPI001E8D793C|nr:uncharacterized protein LAJ45_07935 [Morchella importuna]KAH8148171.1 hypothetical protein LAJ45_07935 [Morchella importuna]